MTLSAGDRLGPYKVLALIGRGGMGEVYRALDTKLDREVAVKILPAAFSSDPKRLARFEREAKMLAQLNHPGIASIYGVEDRALIMELVPGPTLADRIKQGPIPAEEVAALLLQIADALEFAHERGVIHRDLKPANIKIDPDDKVKILDFGLAKALTDPAESVTADLSDSPTVTLGSTDAGTILGTAAYMAPEQARGKKVDKRADIWAFGTVVWEMLTAERLFQGEDTVQVLSSVLRQPIDLSRLPARFRKLLGRCLDRNVKDRLRDIGEARFLMAEPELAMAPAVGTEPKGPRWMWPVVAGAIAIIALWGWLRPRPEATAQDFALTILPPKNLKLPQVGTPLISPDGTSVLFINELRNLNSFQMEEVRGMQGITNEGFWSPDSKWVAFPAQAQLRKLRLPDGAPEDVAPLPGFNRGGSWSPDGTMLLAARAQDAGDALSLYVLPPGGKFTELSVPGLPRGNYYHPNFLPDGSDFLFLFRTRNSREGTVYLGTLKNGQVVNPTQLMQNDTAAHYTSARGGRLLYVRNDSLYSQHLNLSTRKLEGDPELLQPGVASERGDARPGFSVSRTGVVAWRPGTQSYSVVTTFDRQGRPVGTSGPRGTIVQLRLSPDENHLLTGEGGGGETLLLERDQPGSSGFDDRWYAWSPDGAHLLGFQKDKIVERSVSGQGEIRPVASAPGIAFLEDVSPDGKVALYTDTARGLQSVRIDGSGRPPVQVVQTNELIFDARFSPDGRWVVYTVRSATGSGIYVQPFPAPGLRRQIASAGLAAVWRGDGKEILYLGRVGMGQGIRSIPVTGLGGDVRFGTSIEMFPTRPLNLVYGRNPLGVTRDGSRIFFPQAAEKPDVPEVIQVKFGWNVGKPSTR